MSSQVLKYYNTDTLQWEPIVIGAQGIQGIQGISGSGGGGGELIEAGPDFTYTNNILTRIDYDSGNYKLFTYTNGNLTRIDYIRLGSTTIRKDFVYSGGLLDYITQTEI